MTTWPLADEKLSPHPNLHSSNERIIVSGVQWDITVPADIIAVLRLCYWLLKNSDPNSASCTACHRHQQSIDDDVSSLQEQARLFGITNNRTEESCLSHMLGSGANFAKVHTILL